MLNEHERQSRMDDLRYDEHDNDVRAYHDAPARAASDRAAYDLDAHHLDERVDDAPVATETEKPFPVLEEPTWLDAEDDEELEEPRDSAFRGIWIGVAAAAVTFVLVFAVPHWLGWYDIGPSTPKAKRDLTPDSVIASVTAKSPGEAPAAEAPAPQAPTPAAPPAAPPAPAVPAVEHKAPALPPAASSRPRHPAR
jgi:hypothetical protein